MRGAYLVAAVPGWVGLSLASRRWHRRWGATGDEAAASLPGDAMLPGPVLQTTRAIRIEASPEAVWPWLVQMGQGRGGFYTYEWIENLLGAQIHNLDRIDPDLQDLRLGDHVRLTPETYLGWVPGQFYRVIEIQPGRALVMVQELPTGGLTSWSFTLRPAGAAATRLVVRGRSSVPTDPVQRVARAVELALLELGYFVMERGMLRGLKQRCEMRRAHPRGLIRSTPAGSSRCRRSAAT